MGWQISPYFYLLIASGVLSAGLALYAWLRRGATALAVLMAGVSVWALGYALESGAPGVDAKVFWAKVQYLGISTVPLAWLAFCARYTGREGWLTRRNLALLVALPLATLLLVWTNETHNLVWASTTSDPSRAFPALVIEYGPWFYVYWIYSQALILAGTILLLPALVRSLRLYRRQGVVLLVAAAIPWVGNVAYVLGLVPVPGLDLTPFAFLLAGAALLLGLFGFRLLDLVPVARENVVEGMADGVIVADPQDRVVDVNPAAGRILGLPAAEAVGMTLAGLAPAWKATFEEHRATGGTVRSEVKGTGEKEDCDYELTLSPVVDRRGRRKGRLVLLRDVTENRRAERALRESELRLRTVVSNAPVVLFGLDGDGLFTFSEGKGLGTLGLKAGEVVGRSVFEVYQDSPGVLDDARRALEGEAFVATARVAGRVFETRYSPLRGDEGEVAGTIGVAIDVTERVRAEEERARRTAELSRSNRELEQFAHSVSHDLRAPLRSIDGFSRILQEDHAESLNAEGADHLGRVRAAAQRMGMLIDALLDLSRVTRVEMRRTDVDLSALAREVAGELQREDPGRDARFEIQDDLAAEGDARLLRLVVENLLDNAWKFTRNEPEAKIRFGAYRREDGATVFFVRDNGAGFDPRYAGSLFGPFQRLHAEDEFEGTGMGLATVARIVHRHGGATWAEGEPGRGATFFFTLESL